MNSQQYLMDIISKFNSDENHPGLTPIERGALLRIKEIEKSIVELANKSNTLVKEINERNEELVNTQGQIGKLRAKSEGIQEMLILVVGSDEA